MTATASANSAASEPASESGSTGAARRDVPVPAWFDMRDHMSGLGSQLAGPANVIMQLSWPEVGYGVKNSRVHDGSAMKHPVKRARTTFTYLAVSLLGSEEERTAFRKAVNGQHAQVVSRPEEKVQYRAMDPRLQLWVAACLYYGTIDVIERLYGPLDEDEADALYAHCARLGTSLQVPADSWPEDREAFDRYWEESLAHVDIDADVREYLLRLTLLHNVPGPAARLLGPSQLFFTTGFLPPAFREAMGLPWNDAKQRRFDRVLRRMGAIEGTLPVAMRNLPFNILLRDMNRRRGRGTRLV